MELYKEILAQILRKGEIKITYSDFEGDVADAVELNVTKHCVRSRE